MQNFETLGNCLLQLLNAPPFVHNFFGVRDPYILEPKLGMIPLLRWRMAKNQDLIKLAALHTGKRLNELKKCFTRMGLFHARQGSSGNS